MIALEWHVGALRQRGIPFEAMEPDDRLAVLTHYYKRTQAPTFDATTLEPATGLDLVYVQRSLTSKRKAPADDGGDGMRSVVERLTAGRDAAVARQGRGRGD